MLVVVMMSLCWVMVEVLAVLDDAEALDSFVPMLLFAGLLFDIWA